MGMWGCGDAEVWGCGWAGACVRVFLRDDACVLEVQTTRVIVGFVTATTNGHPPLQKFGGLRRGAAPALRQRPPQSAGTRHQGFPGRAEHTDRMLAGEE